MIQGRKEILDFGWGGGVEILTLLKDMLKWKSQIPKPLLTWLDQAWHTWGVLVRSPWQLVAWKNATLITLCQTYIYCAKYFLPNMSCQRYWDKYIEILVYCLIWYGQNSAAHCHELKWCNSDIKHCERIYSVNLAFGFTQIDLERLIKKRHRLLSKSEKNFTDQALVRFLRSSLKVPKAQPGVGKKEIVNYQLLSSERPKTLTKHRKEKYSLSRKKHSFDMNF